MSAFSCCPPTFLSSAKFSFGDVICFWWSSSQQSQQPFPSSSSSPSKTSFGLFLGHKGSRMPQNSLHLPRLSPPPPTVFGPFLALQAQRLPKAKAVPSLQRPSISGQSTVAEVAGTKKQDPNLYSLRHSRLGTGTAANDDQGCRPWKTFTAFRRGDLCGKLLVWEVYNWPELGKFWRQRQEDDSGWSQIPIGIILSPDKYRKVRSGRFQLGHFPFPSSISLDPQLLLPHHLLSGWGIATTFSILFHRTTINFWKEKMPMERSTMGKDISWIFQKMLETEFSIYPTYLSLYTLFEQGRSSPFSVPSVIMSHFYLLLFLVLSVDVLQTAITAGIRP